MDLIAKAKEMFDCDDAKIESPLGTTQFLLTGKKRHTKEDEGQWYRNGEPHDFEYTDWRVICRGDTEEELLADMERYKRLTEMSFREWVESEVL